MGDVTGTVSEFKDIRVAVDQSVRLLLVKSAGFPCVHKNSDYAFVLPAIKMCSKKELKLNQVALCSAMIRDQ